MAANSSSSNHGPWGRPSRRRALGHRLPALAGGAPGRHPGADLLGPPALRLAAEGQRHRHPPGAVEPPHGPLAQPQEMGDLLHVDQEGPGRSGATAGFMVSDMMRTPVARRCQGLRSAAPGRHQYLPKINSLDRRGSRRPEAPQPSGHREAAYPAVNVQIGRSAGEGCGDFERRSRAATARTAGAARSNGPERSTPSRLEGPPPHSHPTPGMKGEGLSCVSPLTTGPWAADVGAWSTDADVAAKVLALRHTTSPAAGLALATALPPRRARGSDEPIEAGRGLGPESL